MEWVQLEQDLQRRPPNEARGSSIGLGYRVPLVIASPWSRGGYVNSQVFDHTSVLQFLEKFLTHKTGKRIEESNISAWRRTVCGDLTSVFRPYNGEKISLPLFLEKDDVIEGIHKSKFRDYPSGYVSISKEEVEQFRNSASMPVMVKQEIGTRPANALPYEIYAEGKMSDDKNSFVMQLEAGNTIFGDITAGSAFHIYTNNNKDPRAYAVKAGDRLADSFKMSDFDNGNYQLKVYGPNGFYREFAGNKNDPNVNVRCNYEMKGGGPTGNIEVTIANSSDRAVKVKITDLSYKRNNLQRSIKNGGKANISLNLKENHGWYDFTVSIDGINPFIKRYAGRVENGKETITDPVMGGIVT